MMKKYMGFKVKDLVSGVEGVMVAYGEYPNAAAMVTIAPAKGKDGKVPNHESVDEVQIKVLSKSPVIEPTKASPAKYEWFQTVKDKATGYEGKVVGRCVYLNGCARLLVQQKHSEKREELDTGCWFPEGNVEVVGKLLKPEVKEKPKTGGPAPHFKMNVPKQ
jgi:hypothetical protein